MKQYISPPKLSTSFSEKGEKAKQRFDNILSTKTKKKGAFLFVVIFMLTCILGTLVACTNIIGTSDDPLSNDVTQNIKELYDAKIQYIGDASGVGKIVELLSDLGGPSPASMELETTAQPYGIILKFNETSINENELEKHARVVLCLVENADFIKYVFSDNSHNYSRNNFDNELERSLSEYGKDFDSFLQLYNLTNSYPLTTDEVISKIILNQNTGDYAFGECVGEGHIILQTKEVTNAKSEMNKIFYTLVMYGEYGFQNGNFIKTSGTGVIPVRITLDQNNNLIEYLEPMDGSYYASSIKEMFPENFYKRAVQATNEDMEICKKQERVYAQTYLDSIGRDAQIGDYGDFEHTLPQINVEASNTLLSSMYGEFPYWIGTIEKIENGARYVYETEWADNGNGDGIVTFKKYEYINKNVVEETVIEINDGKITYLSGTPRNENHSKYNKN